MPSKSGVLVNSWQLMTYCLFLVLGFGTIGNADVVYSYLGNNFVQIVDLSPPSGPAGSYDTSMSISGSMTLTSPLAPNLFLLTQIIPNAYIFTDGRNTFTDATSLSVEQLFVSTNSQGDIVNWYFHLQEQPISPWGSILSSKSGVLPFFVDQGDVSDFGNADTGQNTNNPGTWTSVPEPSSSALIGVVIGFLLFRRRESRTR